MSPNQIFLFIFFLHSVFLKMISISYNIQMEGKWTIENILHVYLNYYFAKQSDIMIKDNKMEQNGRAGPSNC